MKNNYGIQMIAEETKKEITTKWKKKDDDAARAKYAFELSFPISAPAGAITDFWLKINCTLLL